MKLFRLNGMDFFDNGDCMFDIDYFVYDDPRGRIIAREAFDKSLIANNYECILLWSHDPQRPLGTVKIMPTFDCLSINATIKGEQYAKEVIGLLKEMYLKNQVEDYMDFGVGYDVITTQTVFGVPYATECRLWEASIGAANYANSVEALAKGMKLAPTGDPRYRYKAIN
jgi:hypothetical protein